MDHQVLIQNKNQEVEVTTKNYGTRKKYKDMPVPAMA